MTRFPAADQVAIVGVGATGYTRHGSRTATALAIEAAQNAIRDAGLRASNIDGLIGAAWNACPPPASMQAALGIPEASWSVQHLVPFATLLISAMSAVFAGVCTTALVYAGLNRMPGQSRSAAGDPFRERLVNNLGGLQWGGRQIPGLSSGYAGWMRRYMHEHGATREDFGLLAISARSYAADNPRAIFRDPLTMDDYLAARMIREPMCLLDMDVPIDGGDALVVTTVERARDLPRPPVLIHAATYGQTCPGDDDRMAGLSKLSKQAVASSLWRRSAIGLDAIDLFFPYDGFSVIMMTDFEAAGYCGPGEAPDFVRGGRDPATGRIRIDGRVSVNPHGGALSEGGTQSAGHVREAVTQLRGAAGARQAAAVKTALLLPGSLFFNAAGLILRAD